jgi:hypothetical protein
VSGAGFMSCIVGKRYFLNLLALDVNSDFSLIGGIGFWYVPLPHIVRHIMLGSAEDISFS